jgi:uracil-DNA glycosylase family 4
MTQHCPSCLAEIVPPSGNKLSKILIVGEMPGENELEHGKPFCGPTGKVLRAELRRAGIEPFLCRMANLWLHEPNKEENCYKAGLDIVLDEAKGKEAILLVGSECAEAFVGMKIMDICGLQVTSPMLSCDTVFAMVNPAIVFKPGGGVGEIRLALKKFGDACRQKGLIEDE